MRTSINLLLLFVSSVAFSQKIDNSTIITLSKSLMFQPVSTVRDSLICAETNYLTQKTVADSVCRSFRLVINDKSLFKDDITGFSTLFIHIDSLKIVTGLSLFKQHLAAGYSSGLIKKDFAALVEHLNGK